MKKQTLGPNRAGERRAGKRFLRPRSGNDWTEEGQMLLDDPKLWLDHLTFSWVCHASRKRDRTTEDGTFLLHKKGAVTSTFTDDWLLTEGESRD
jgi:hypothetical protein